MLKKKYSKIVNLYRSEAQCIFDLENVVATEKLDGTNFSFGLINGEPRMNSRNNQVWGIKKEALQPFYNRDFDGYGFVKAFQEQFGLEIFDKLKKHYNDVLIFGEFYGQGIMNRVDYGLGKKFAFFDAYDLINNEWFLYEQFKLLIEEMNLPMVPELYVGPPKLSIFERLLNQNSKLAIENGVTKSPNLQEGIVIKGLYNEIDKWNERIIVKFKQDKFLEVKTTKGVKGKKLINQENSLLTFAEEIADKYVTESRLHNCIEKLRGQNIPIQISAMGKVVSSLQNDVLEEMDTLEKMDPSFSEKYIKKCVGASSARLYQQYLKNEFEERIR